MIFLSVKKITGQNTANARALGSYQGDAMRNITGDFGGAHYSQDETGAFYRLSGGSIKGSLAASTASTRTAFDASRVTPTAAENRTVNTAYAPRIHI
jgi:hypothetical protein